MTTNRRSAGVPLSAVLVAQGCVLLFLGALYLLARHAREA